MPAVSPEDLAALEELGEDDDGLDDLGGNAFADMALDEYEEDDGDIIDVEPSQPDEDDGALDEAAGADRAGAAAAEDVGEPSTSYPDVPERRMLASDLFGEAAFVEPALWLASRYPQLEVSGVQTNAFLVTPGDVYVMHPGLTPEHPEAQVAKAVEMGAAVVVVPPEAVGGPPDDVLVPQDVPLIRLPEARAMGQRLALVFYGFPSQKLVTVGVVGSLGKTTTSWLIRGMLEEVGQVVGMAGSIEYAISEDRLDEDGYLWEALEEDPSEGRECSVPFKLVPYAGKYELYYGEAGLPGANAQKVLAGMRDRGATVAVIEAPAAALARGAWDFLDVNVAVVTNLSGTAPGVTPAAMAGIQRRDVATGRRTPPEVVLASVQAFVEQLCDSSKQALVLNVDDPAAPAVVEALRGRVPVVTFSATSRTADVYMERNKANIWENEVLIRTPAGRLQIITGLLGTHNVRNVLAAVATGIALKVPLPKIVAGIEAVEVIPGRSEIIDEGQPFSVIVDAAKTPEQLADMLDAVRQAGARQVLTVLGCSGGEDVSLRPRMGAVAHAKSDIVIITNENPRNEDPAKIVQDIVAGLPDDIVNRYSAYAYPPFQDQGRTPLWFEPYLQKAQRDNKRYIMEDRYSAIRAAIGTAGPEDVVLLVGKGCQDWVEHLAEDGSIVRGWLDDRVEARNALLKLKYLEEIGPKFQREVLPWGPKIETMMESLTIDPRVTYRTGE